MKGEIFREYDIRGVWGRDFDGEDVRAVGRVYGTRLGASGGKRITVARDCRLSSPQIREALVEGLLDAGAEVLDLGVCPTPLLYFSLRHFQAAGGIMVTASHNPRNTTASRYAGDTTRSSARKSNRSEEPWKTGNSFRGPGAFYGTWICSPLTAISWRPTSG